MSNELTQARQQLLAVRTYLRQSKQQPAVQALYSTLITVLKTPLMKAEREEFERLLEDAVYNIAADKEIRQLFPTQLVYKPGTERQLLDQVHMLLETLDEEIKDGAQDYLRLLVQRRDKLFADGENFLLNGNVEKASQTFQLLASENKDDADLWGRIGEAFLNRQMYEEAIPYLEKALQMTPDMAHLYNKVAMALRKVGQFETAEKYYLMASNYLPRDSNLFFNLGRLYVDWKQWPKAIRAAEASLTLEPDFEAGQKLLNYAKKMQAETGE